MRAGSEEWGINGEIAAYVYIYIYIHIYIQVPFKGFSGFILLMDEILHHLGALNYCNT